MYEPNILANGLIPYILPNQIKNRDVVTRNSGDKKIDGTENMLA